MVSTLVIGVLLLSVFNHVSSSYIQHYVHLTWHIAASSMKSEFVFTHLESSAAEEEVKDKQRSHGEPTEITKCLIVVMF